MSHDDEVNNRSGNRPFHNVLEAYASRRTVVTGGLTVAASSFIGSSLAWAEPSIDNRKPPRGPGGEIDFTPVPVADGTGPEPTISEDYEYATLIPWGTPLFSDTPEYAGDPASRPSSAEQARQVGIGHDGMHFFPVRGRGKRRGVLAINHEFGRNSHLLGKDGPESLEDVLLSQHAHGVSLVDIRKPWGQDNWEVVTDSPINRRIHVNTPVAFSGPVAGTDLIAPEDGARGTVNNCANGHTPWGTYLTCEENFNGYFGATNGLDMTEARERYGFSESGFNYGWEKYDERFDLSSQAYPNEENRFGWVVEIDPNDPQSTPMKRTALGRFKHEGVALTVGRGGRAVAYMGDDQRFDYIYKFVSDDNYESMLAQGMSPLDHGALYVARFNDDGSGDWLELTIDNPDLAAAFGSQAEVLTYARMAADILGATPMDRPEWAAVARNGDVYCTLTNNSRRDTADAANPLAPNSDGHIIRWRDADKHIGTTFTWDIFIISQDTHADGDERTFSDPDGLYIDPEGRMFIQTDGGQQKDLNNQLLVCSVNGDNNASNTLDVRRLFTGVTSDEITGIAMTPDRRTLFINTQHPGNGDPSLTNFPSATDGVTIPRDCTFVIRRKDGGIIGS